MLRIIFPGQDLLIKIFSTLVLLFFLAPIPLVAPWIVRRSPYLSPTENLWMTGAGAVLLLAWLGLVYLWLLLTFGRQMVAIDLATITVRRVLTLGSRIIKVGRTHCYRLEKVQGLRVEPKQGVNGERVFTFDYDGKRNRALFRHCGRLAGGYLVHPDYGRDRPVNAGEVRKAGRESPVKKVPSPQ